MNIQATWALAPIVLATILGVGTSAIPEPAASPESHTHPNIPLTEAADQNPENGGSFRIFIRIDGLTGPVDIPGYVGWFDAQALQSDVAAPPRGQPGRSFLPPQRFIGNLATALPPLLANFANGRPFAEVDLAFVLPTPQLTIPVLTLELENVRVTDVLQREDGSQDSNNFASLSYETIVWRTSHFDAATGWQINRNRAGWDLVNQRRL